MSFSMATNNKGPKSASMTPLSLPNTPFAANAIVEEAMEGNNTTIPETSNCNDEEDNSNVAKNHFTDVDVADTDESSDSECEDGGSNDEDASSATDNSADVVDSDDYAEELEEELRELELKMSECIQFLCGTLEE